MSGAPKTCPECHKAFARPEGMFPGVWMRRVYCSQECRIDSCRLTEPLSKRPRTVDALRGLHRLFKRKKKQREVNEESGDL